MKILVIACCISLFLLTEDVFARPGMDAETCALEKKMAGVGMADSYANYGFCLLDGIDGAKDIQRAKNSFVAGAMLGSGYSKYWAGNTLIFHAENSTEDLMGRLLLTELANANGSRFSKAASYALGVYEFSKGNLLSAQKFLEKAKAGGGFAASYAMLYSYFDKEKSQVDMQRVSLELEEANDLWTSFDNQSPVPKFQCWVLEASGHRVPLSTSAEVLGIIESKLGGCSAQ